MQIGASKNTTKISGWSISLEHIRQLQVATRLTNESPIISCAERKQRKSQMNIFVDRLFFVCVFHLKTSWRVKYHQNLCMQLIRVLEHRTKTHAHTERNELC